MATGKRYYWMKLKETFMTSDTIDYFMGLPNGANYVVLYQLLCLKTINTGGRLSRQIGEIIIPYDVAKIQRDCKWFSADTVRVALNLYKSFGLIYEDIDGVLCLAGHSGLVGSETDYAVQKKTQRQMPNVSPPKLEDKCVDNSVDNVHDNVHTDIDIRDRDKEIDIRDKSLDTDKEELILSDESIRSTDVQRVILAWNALGLQSIKKIVPDTDRYIWLKRRIKDYGLEEVLNAIERVKSSKFLMGKSTDFMATFDWFIRPNNFPKVWSGNYDDRQDGSQQEGINTSNPFLKRAMERKNDT